MSAGLLPLCVDLDDTLVMGDTVFLAIRDVIRRTPWLLPVLLWQFLKGGRPAAKTWMAAAAPIDVSRLSYRTGLLEYLRAEKSKGRKIYLVSAASQDTATRVAAHTKLFDAAYGSDATFNLKGKNKAAFIKEKIAPRFVYAGDSFADLVVWNEAEAAIICGSKAFILRRILNRAVEAVFDRDPRRARDAAAAQPAPRAR